MPHLPTTIDHGVSSDAMLEQSDVDAVGLLPGPVAMNEVIKNRKLVIFSVIFYGWDMSIWAKHSVSKIEDIINERIIVSPNLSISKLG